MKAAVIVALILCGCGDLSPTRIRQRRTMAKLRTIGFAVEAYGSDFKHYPDDDTFAHGLTPTYVRAFDYKDEWGNAIKYEAWDDGFAVASAADDGKFASGSLRLLQPKRTEDADEDIVYRIDRFVQYPKDVEYQ